MRSSFAEVCDINIKVESEFDHHHPNYSYSIYHFVSDGLLFCSIVATRIVPNSLKHVFIDCINSENFIRLNAIKHVVRTYRDMSKGKYR